MPTKSQAVACNRFSWLNHYQILYHRGRTNMNLRMSHQANLCKFSPGMTDKESFHYQTTGLSDKGQCTLPWISIPRQQCSFQVGKACTDHATKRQGLSCTFQRDTARSLWPPSHCRICRAGTAHTYFGWIRKYRHRKPCNNPASRILGCCWMFRDGTPGKLQAWLLQQSHSRSLQDTPCTNPALPLHTFLSGTLCRRF